MRRLRFAFSYVCLFSLVACAQKPTVQRVVPANPWGYQKASALCKTTASKNDAGGHMAVSMTVRSDDGLCAIALQKPDKTAFVSFGVDPAPTHGKVFIYNFDDHTYVTYTPTTAYAGKDTFMAILIPGSGAPRLKLLVDAVVDATDVSASGSNAAAIVASKTDSKATVAPVRSVKPGHSTPHSRVVAKTVTK